MPVKNWRSHTNLAINSILKQTISDLELIVIGQTDVSWGSKLPADRRIVLLTREQTGIVGALNTGLKFARGHYIARMDDDDVAYPHRLQTQIDYLKHNPTIKLCGARVRFIDVHGKTSSIQAGNQYYQCWLNGLTRNQEIKAACFAESPLPHPTWLAHRRTWKAIGDYRHFDGPEDYDFVLRAMLNGISMGKPDEILQDWREHKDRLTYTDNRYKRQAFTRCSALAIADARSGFGLDKTRQVWLCGTGRLARDWNLFLEEQSVTVNGFVDINVSKPGTVKRNKPVISYQELVKSRDGCLIIGALSQRAAKDKLRRFFDEQHWTFGEDFVMGG